MSGFGCELWSGRWCLGVIGFFWEKFRSFMVAAWAEVVVGWNAGWVEGGNFEELGPRGR